MADAIVALNASPTGRNLMLGIFVLPVFDHDPSTDPDPSVDGVTGVWVDGANIKLSVFIRSLGWKVTTLS